MCGPYQDGIQLDLAEVSFVNSGRSKGVNAFLNALDDASKRLSCIHLDSFYTSDETSERTSEHTIARIGICLNTLIDWENAKPI